MFEGTGSNRDVRPESLSRRRYGRRSSARRGRAELANAPQAQERATELDPLLVRKRRRIETVAGKLVGLYRAKRVWVTDR